MCFTGGHDERDVYASEYLQLRIAISRNVVKLRQNKVHLSELWWQVAKGDESKIDQQQSSMISPLLGSVEGPPSIWPQRKLQFTENSNLYQSPG